MSIAADQLDAAVTEWEFDHEDDDLMDEYGSFWNIVIEESVELPGGIGLVKSHNNGVFLEDGDKMEFVTVKIGDQFFRITGWYDSWGGEHEWDGALTEVEEVEVITKEWRVKG